MGDLASSASLLFLKFTPSDGFPWSAVAHRAARALWFGYRNLDAEVTARQHKLEERAPQLL